MSQIGAEIEVQTERVLLIHVATAIHAACITSNSAPGDVADSVSEAIDLIAEVDSYLSKVEDTDT